MRLIDLDGNTWDGTKLNSKYKPVYDSRGRNEMMGVTLGWLYDAPEFDLEKNNVEIRNKAIDDFVETLIPRLTDAIYQKDVEGMSNLINDIAEQLKKGDANNE